MLVTIKIAGFNGLNKFYTLNLNNCESMHKYTIKKELDILQKL